MRIAAIVACVLTATHALQAPPTQRTRLHKKTRRPAPLATPLSDEGPVTLTSSGDVVSSTDAAYDAELAAARRERAKERLEKIQRINTLAYVNGGVLLFVALGVAYELFHVDVEAIVALYTYCLPVENEDAYRLATSLDLLARLPMDSIHSYEALVPTNPIFYKACTSGVAYTLGDFVSQIYQGRNLKSVDLARSARSGAAGFVGHGPLCHFWMVWMEAHLDFDGAWYGTGVKVFADQTVWSLYLNAMYSFLIGAFALRNPKDVREDVKATSWPALRSSWRFWPFVHTISFSHLVPLDLKLLWVDAMEIVWVTILSKVANDDKVAKLDEDPEAESVLAVLEPFGTDPALEIELTREFELDASLDFDLRKEDQFDEKKLSFELPKQIAKAAWPLVVMWPVIFCTFQAEKALAGTGML